MVVPPCFTDSLAAFSAGDLWASVCQEPLYCYLYRFDGHAWSREEELCVQVTARAGDARPWESATAGKAARLRAAATASSGRFQPS